MATLSEIISGPTPPAVTAAVAASTVVIQGIIDQLRDAPLPAHDLYWIIKGLSILNVLIAGAAIFINSKKASENT